MINDLIRHKNHFWCHHCERGLFFPSTCVEHADTVILGDEEEVEDVAEEEDEADDGDLLGDDEADFVV